MSEQFVRRYREEPGRFSVEGGCCGVGSISETGEVFKFRGVDASQHGFGCIISRYIEKGSKVTLTFGSNPVSFEVMWCESHLGIGEMHRVGFTACDLNVNVESMLSQLGLLETVTQLAS